MSKATEDLIKKYSLKLRLTEHRVKVIVRELTPHENDVYRDTRKLSLLATIEEYLTYIGDRIAITNKNKHNAGVPDRGVELSELKDRLLSKYVYSNFMPYHTGTTMTSLYLSKYELAIIFVGLEQVRKEIDDYTYTLNSTLLNLNSKNA